LKKGGITPPFFLPFQSIQTESYSVLRFHQKLEYPARFFVTYAKLIHVKRPLAICVFDDNSKNHHLYKTLHHFFSITLCYATSGFMA